MISIAHTGNRVGFFHVVPMGITIPIWRAIIELHILSKFSVWNIGIMPKMSFLSKKTGKWVVF